MVAQGKDYKGRKKGPYHVYWVDGWHRVYPSTWGEWLANAWLLLTGRTPRIDYEPDAGVKLTSHDSPAAAFASARNLESWAQATYGGALAPGMCVVLDDKGERLMAPGDGTSPVIAFLAGPRHPPGDCLLN